MLRLALIAVFAAGAASCTHPQLEGPYRLTLDEVMRDDCNLAQNPEVTAALTLKVDGEVVSGEYSLLDVQLVGAFLETGLIVSTEQFSLDGSASNVEAPVNGVPCLLDQVHVHLEATTRDPSSFGGLLLVELAARHPDACACQLQAKVSGQRAP